MSKFKYDANEILRKTNGGLDIFKHYYQGIEVNANGKSRKNFRIREDDKNPSAAIYPPNGNSGAYKIKEFATGETLTCFDVIKREEHIEDFGEICRFIYESFGLDPNSPTFSSAEIEMVPAEKGQKAGDFSYKEKEFTKEELTVLGPLMTKEFLEEFPIKIRSAESFTRVKHYPKDAKSYDGSLSKYAGKTMQVILKSKPNYPIFIFDCGSFQKIYQPLAREKGFRFSYAGNKPDEFIFNLESLEKEFDRKLTKAKKYCQGLDLMAGNKTNNLGLPILTEKFIRENGIDRKRIDPRFERVFICSGDRDALNCASMRDENGEHLKVIWKNSETKALNAATFWRIRRLAKNIYNVPDLDKTGVEEGKKMALNFIEIATVWLPDSIKEHAYRGKPGKDLTDFVRMMMPQRSITEKNFDEKRKKLENYFLKIVDNGSYKTRFWYEKKTAKGLPRGYGFQLESFKRFLRYEGFSRYEDEFSKNVEYIRKVDGVTRIIDEMEVLNFPQKWANERLLPPNVVEFIHSTNKINTRQIAKLPKHKIDFQYSTYDYTDFHFENVVWRISKEEIKEIRYNEYSQDLLEDHIIKDSVYRDSAPYFSIEKDENGNFKYTRQNKGFIPVLEFIENTARVYWKDLGLEPFRETLEEIAEDDPDKYEKREQIKVDFENYRKANSGNLEEKGLDPDKVLEQHLHLCNVISIIGYLLDDWKRPNEPYMVVGMDDDVSGATARKGGTGKSMILSKLVPVMKQGFMRVAATDKKQMDDSHLLGNVTSQTKYIYFDDVYKGFDWGKLFTYATEGISVRPQYSNPITYDYKHSPKISATSNFAFKNLDDSYKRRLKFFSNSDFYHFWDNFWGPYSPFDNFEMSLFVEDWEEKYKIQTYNFLAYCLQIYKRFGVIDPPMGNLRKRNAIMEIGESVLSFMEENIDQYYDQEIYKDDLYKHYSNWCKDSGQKYVKTKTRFKEAVKAYCTFKGLQFNPPSKVKISKGTNDKAVKWDGEQSRAREIFFLWDKEGIIEEEKSDRQKKYESENNLFDEL